MSEQQRTLTSFSHQLFSLKLRTKSMLSHRCSRYKDRGRVNNSSIRWKEHNNVKRVDSTKVGMLSNLCETIFHFFPFVLLFYGCKSSTLANEWIIRELFLTSRIMLTNSRRKFIVSPRQFSLRLVGVKASRNYKLLANQRTTKRAL